MDGKSSKIHNSVRLENKFNLEGGKEAQCSSIDFVKATDKTSFHRSLILFVSVHKRQG